MSATPLATGCAFLCSLDGTIRRVLADALGLVPSPIEGQPFSLLLLPESRGKADRFFDAVRADAAAFDWELIARTTNGICRLHMAASIVDGGVLVVGAPSRSVLAQLFAEMMPQAGRLVDAAAAGLPPPEDRSADVYDEVSRINNELVNAQRALFKVRAEERRLAEENRQLYEAERGARAAAEAAVMLRDRLLAGIAHDLRSPLTAIGGMAQLLEHQASRRGPDAAWLLGKLANITASATRMAEMIDELLTAARLQIGQLVELRPAETDLVTLARTVVARHQELMDHHRIEVVATVPALVGNWDFARLERVLDNLLSNAVKYSPAGGSVTVKIEQQADTTGRWAVLAVQDDGIGIPAIDLPHVFDWFHRGTNVTGRTAGIGIGLAGAKQLIEQHGGTLTAESIESQGSTFTVRLPLM